MTTYPGGKNHTFRNFINLMPPHQIYIELFLGSGAVMAEKRPARLNIGIDRDLDALAIAEKRIDGIDYASAVGKAIEKNGYRVQNGIATAGIDENDCMAPNFQFINTNAIDWLDDYQFTGNEFLYADPPYVLSSRSQQVRIYEYEMTNDDHINLLTKLKLVDTMVMISGYWSELYADMLTGWHVSTFEAMTRGGKMATEHIWTNFPPPSQLHDYRYLGDGFTDRQRIKRKAARWVNRFQNLPRLERAAIVEQLEAAGVLVGVRTINQI